MRESKEGKNGGLCSMFAILRHCSFLIFSGLTVGLKVLDDHETSVLFRGIGHQISSDAAAQLKRTLIHLNRCQNLKLEYGSVTTRRLFLLRNYCLFSVALNPHLLGYET
jgi:hypothetical protein